MKIFPTGDCGFVLHMDCSARAAACARAMRADAMTGMDEVFAAYEQVAVRFRPEAVSTRRGADPWQAVEEWARRTAEDGNGRENDSPEPRSRVIPVCYGKDCAPDLAEVAARTGLSQEEVVRRHQQAQYTVAAVGFAPGFPYLAGLPPELALPRKNTPALRVAAGSVGIGGAQTGIYPQALPGGWWIIGRTATRLFDPRLDPPALLAAGDDVGFSATDRLSREVERIDVRNPPVDGIPVFEVLEPGMQDTLQDKGRRGMARFGVSGGGVMDPWSAMIANLGVGNQGDAAVLEITYVGPVLRVLHAGWIALGGAAAGGLPPGMPHAVRRGEVIDLRKLNGGAARCWLAIGGGGFSAPLVLGSRATHLGGGFGGMEGRALRAGDVLFAEEHAPGHAPVRLASPAPRNPREGLEILLAPSPDWPESTAAFENWRGMVEEAEFRISDASNRMGIRLAGNALPALCEPPPFSRPVLPGTVQLPPDGRPILVHVECQTIGGYPCLGHVPTPDLARVARALPGTPVRFRVAGIEEARAGRLRRATAAARMEFGVASRRS